MSPTSVVPDDAKYLNLRSFKKNGQPVDTPVWFAKLDDHFMVFTDGTSYKVKRIRKNPRVEIARCDVRGKVLGPWQPATCRPVEGDAARIAQSYALLNGKYGLIMRLLTFFATLGGRVGRRLILEITPAAT